VAAGLTATLDLGDGIFACHGRPHDDNAYLLENVEAGRLVPARYTQVVECVRAVGLRFALCVHSHIPGAAAADDTMVINPGSVGLLAYEDPTPPAHVSESGSPLARYAVLHLDAGKASFEHIAIPYDHLSAARRAEKNQNPAWAHFLATGYAARLRLETINPAGA
jgi:predicted phosphodiesterase